MRLSFATASPDPARGWRLDGHTPTSSSKHTVPAFKNTDFVETPEQRNPNIVNQRGWS